MPWKVKEKSVTAVIDMLALCNITTIALLLEHYAQELERVRMTCSSTA